MNPKDLELPFLHRLMLKFEQATRFGLTIDSMSHVATTISIRGATRNGIFHLKHTTTSTGLAVRESYNLPDLPIWISISVNGAGRQPGQIFARASLQINGDTVEGLCAGYLYDTKTLDWPFPASQDPVPRDIGRLNTLVQASATAGTSASLSATLYRLSEIVCGNVTLTTSATVANRRVHFRIVGSGPVNLDFLSSVDQAASTTRKYTFAPVGSAGVYSDDDDILVPIMPGFMDYDEYSVFVSATNLQAGDQFTNFNLRMKEYMYAGDFV